MICSESEVNKYLKETKGRIKEHGIIFIKKAEEEIMGIGINIEIAKEIILRLDKKNYVRGPDKDLNFPLNNIWIFGSESPTGFYEIYIKLSDRKDNQRVVCISFHSANSLLKHPYK